MVHQKTLIRFMRGLFKEANIPNDEIDEATEKLHAALQVGEQIRKKLGNIDLVKRTHERGIEQLNAEAEALKKQCPHLMGTGVEDSDKYRCDHCGEQIII